MMSTKHKAVGCRLKAVGGVDRNSAGPPPASSQLLSLAAAYSPQPTAYRFRSSHG
jgi:hypothetical protein